MHSFKYPHASVPYLFASTQGGEVALAEQLANEKYVSALPFLPPLSAKTLRNYYAFYASFGE
jgi:hypothetical protein